MLAVIAGMHSLVPVTPVLFCNPTFVLRTRHGDEMRAASKDLDYVVAFQWSGGVMFASQ